MHKGVKQEQFSSIEDVRSILSHFALMLSNKHCITNFKKKEIKKTYKI